MHLGGAISKFQEVRAVERVYRELVACFYRRGSRHIMKQRNFPEYVALTKVSISTRQLNFRGSGGDDIKLVADVPKSNYDHALWELLLDHAANSPVADLARKS